MIETTRPDRLCSLPSGRTVWFAVLNVGVTDDENRGCKDNDPGTHGFMFVGQDFDVSLKLNGFEIEFVDVVAEPRVNPQTKRVQIRDRSEPGKAHDEGASRIGDLGLAEPEKVGKGMIVEPLLINSAPVKQPNRFSTSQDFKALQNLGSDRSVPGRFDEKCDCEGGNPLLAGLPDGVLFSKIPFVEKHLGLAYAHQH
jgi:hypothetical protein